MIVLGHFVNVPFDQPTRNGFLNTGRTGQLQKVDLTKSKLAKNFYQSILVILCMGWLLGILTFWKSTISRITYFLCVTDSEAK